MSAKPKLMASLPWSFCEFASGMTIFKAGGKSKTFTTEEKEGTEKDKNK